MSRYSHFSAGRLDVPAPPNSDEPRARPFRSSGPVLGRVGRLPLPSMVLSGGDVAPPVRHELARPRTRDHAVCHPGRMMPVRGPARNSRQWWWWPAWPVLRRRQPAVDPVVMEACDDPNWIDPSRTTPCSGSHHRPARRPARHRHPHGSRRRPRRAGDRRGRDRRGRRRAPSGRRWNSHPLHVTHRHDEHSGSCPRAPAAVASPGASACSSPGSGRSRLEASTPGSPDRS
jgi:hypothetical protein